MGLREDLGAISKVCRRIVVGMAKNLILLVPDGIDAVDKFHILRENSTDGEGMNPGPSAFFLFQSSSSCDGIIDRHILKSVHLLQIGPQPHQQQTSQGDMVCFTKIHQTFGRLCFQMENIQRGFRVVSGRKG